MTKKELIIQTKSENGELSMNEIARRLTVSKDYVALVLREYNLKKRIAELEKQVAG